MRSKKSKQPRMKSLIPTAKARMSDLLKVLETSEDCAALKPHTFHELERARISFLDVAMQTIAPKLYKEYEAWSQREHERIKSEYTKQGKR